MNEMVSLFDVNKGMMSDDICVDANSSIMERKLALQELKESIIGSGFQCHLETYEMAIEALEKYTPRKVKIMLERDSYYANTPVHSYNIVLVGVCPECGEFLKYLRIDTPNPNYCPCCGQALDWDIEVQFKYIE